ncbi:hypothetical protein V8E54_006218 [Elaphomyces granulatus]
MRTSRVFKEAKGTQLMKPPPTGRHVPNSLCSPAAEVTNNDSTTLVADIPVMSNDSSSLSSISTDIEDALELPLKKQKYRAGTNDPPETSLAKYSYTTKLSSSGSRRHPARRITASARSLGVEPTSEWETVYAIVKDMREKNPTAPVDTMGCAELYWRASSPRDQRFQTLIALMLSSQTKDTVTAEAMQRLHTLLGEHTLRSTDLGGQTGQDSGAPATPVDSTLNLQNILIVSPQRLNELIRTVGFHNNKTKYIKESAIILRDQYNSDIPSTAKELMKLPGVGPKMAYLCMSAAWGKHEGIGVDVHVHRITNLWDWHKTKNPEETRKALESWLPKDKWHEINKLLVGLGQTVCLPIGRKCGECALSGKNLCKGEVKVFLSFSMNVDEKSQVVIPGSEMLGFIRVEAVANRPTNFLDLPEDVRIRIYQYSNLIRPCPIDVFEERKRFKSRSGACSSDLLDIAARMQTRSPYREQPCDHPAIPLNIFRVSRAVFEDASSALYSRNRFRLTLKYLDDFRQFKQMIEPYLYLIKSLYVDLRTSDNRILHLEKVSFNPFQYILRRWEKFCSSVPLTIPGLKDFSLQCRIINAESARRVLGPMSSFPLLSRCAFYFDPLGDNETTLGIAKETAYAVIRASSTPFQFLYLPVELQFLVMEHLLICRWDPFVPPGMVSAGQIILRSHKRQRVFEPICCGTCSTSTSTCFCSFRGSVFSTHCSCFTSPVPYFLVCRQMYTVAHSVFYSKNQFSLIGSNPRLMMRQVRSLANNSLSMIRHLTFAPCGINRNSDYMGKVPKINASSQISWSNLLRFLKDHLRLGLVSINFVDLDCDPDPEIVWAWRAFLREILQFFVFLRGVRNFQVYLGYDRRYEFVVEKAILGPLHRATAVKSLPFEVAKKRTRRVIKSQRAVVGVSLDVIKERQSMRPEARAAARQQAIKDAKEKKAASESNKKAEKAKNAAQAVQGKVQRIQSKQGVKGATPKVSAKSR